MQVNKKVKYIPITIFEEKYQKNKKSYRKVSSQIKFASLLIKELVDYKADRRIDCKTSQLQYLNLPLYCATKYRTIDGMLYYHSIEIDAEGFVVMHSRATDVNHNETIQIFIGKVRISSINATNLLYKMLFQIQHISLDDANMQSTTYEVHIRFITEKEICFDRNPIPYQDQDKLVFSLEPCKYVQLNNKILV